MKFIYRKLVLSLMQTQFYSFLLMKIIPFVRFTTYYTSFTGDKYHQLYSVLKKGDILLTVDKKKLTSFLIPGTWAHVAFCVSKDKKWEISEMTHDNYVKRCVFDVAKESSRIMVLRCDDFDKEYINKVVKRCKSFKNAKYDEDFDLGIKALYCSELIYHSDFEKRLKINLDDLAGLGRKYISPDGLANAKNVSVIWDSDNVK